jgi:hypothetical protein
MSPAGRRPRRLFGTELFGDCDRALPLVRVEVEDALHDRRLHRIGNEQAPLARERVAERWPAAEPASLFRASFDAPRDAVDDRGVLEFGEDAKHLQHHPARGRASIEWLRRRAEYDAVAVKFLGQLGELANLA